MYIEYVIKCPDLTEYYYDLFIEILTPCLYMVYNELWKITFWRDIMYRMAIIEECLEDLQILEDVQPYFISQRVEEVPEDEYPIWHINEYHINDDRLYYFLELLKQFVKKTWYIHMFDEDSLYVILREKWFKVSREKDETWDEMIEYGVSYAEVEREYLESIPLDI